MATNTQPNGQLANADSQIPKLQLWDEDGRQIISKGAHHKSDMGATARTHASWY